MQKPGASFLILLRREIVRLSYLLASAATVALSVPWAASSATLGVDFEPDVVAYPTSYEFTLGYSFTDVLATSVIGLGAWDSGIGGTVEIGLWNSSGDLLATTTVDGSETPVGSAPWVFSSISPVALTPGSVYYVGAYGVENYTFGVSPVTIASSISIDHNAWAHGGLNFPSLSSAPFVEYGFFGANVELGVPSAIPEPSTWVMMGIGFTAIGAAAGIRRRRRKVVAAA
jgi:Domain of unknown function (DUF4082)/PEP-CTERM motif